MGKDLKAQITYFPIFFLEPAEPWASVPVWNGSKVSEPVSLGPACLHLAVSCYSGCWMGSFCRHRWGEQQDDKLVRARPPPLWERDPELRLWVSPVDGLSTAAVQCGKEGYCWSHQSPWLMCLPTPLKECAG